MSFLEPIIAAVLGAGVTALAAFLNKNKTTKVLLKYGPIVEKGVQHHRPCAGPKPAQVARLSSRPSI
jgi:2-keto-4-pentenoate hydratase